MKPEALIVGLGNHGASYARTRHNVGWLALDGIAEAFGAGTWTQRSRFTAEVAEVPDRSVLLLKPQTYMNLSGQAVRKAMDFYKLAPTRVLVLCDDVDLPLGEARFRLKGGPGTHNGLKSLVETIGEDFARIRLGLGTPPPGTDLASWVLSIPTADEQTTLARAYNDALQRAEQWLTETLA